MVSYAPRFSFAIVLLAACTSSGVPDAGDADRGDATADGIVRDGGDCRASTAAPEARGDAVGAVDPETGMLWIVGGDVGPTANCIPRPQFSAEVWRYDPDCDRWTQLMIGEGPSARARAAAALDSRRRRLVMFGGRYRAGTSGAYTLYNEVWALDFATERWERLNTSGSGPSARANASAVYDAEADELVIFGGNTSTDGASFRPQGDTWALNLGTLAWRQIATTGTAPTARLFHAAALRGRQMLIMGGGGANAFTGPFYNDAFVLDLQSAQWTELTLSGDDPLGRINLALVADTTQDRFLLIAGHDDGALGNRNDVLAVSPMGAISTLSAGDAFNRAGSGFCDFPADFATIDPNAPERRSAFVLGVDARRNRALVFGGKTDCGSTNDVWAVDFATGAWRPLRATNIGIACQRSGRTGCTSLCN